MSKWYMVGLGSVLMLLLVSASPAQTTGGFEFHGLTAFGVDGDAGRFGEKDFDVTLGFGASFVVALNEYVKLDFGGDYYALEENDSKKDLAVIPLCAAIRIGGNLDLVYVYGGGGIGYSFNDYDLPGWELDDSMIYFLCAGVEFGLNETLALRGELRYNWLKPELKSEATGESDDWNLNHMQFRLGLSINL